MEEPEFTFEYNENTGSTWLRILVESRSRSFELLGHDSVGDSLGLSDGPWKTLKVGHSGPVTAICHWPEFELVATGGQDGRLLLWNAATGYSHGGGRVHSSPVSGIARLPDGALIVACQGLKGLLRLAPGSSAADNCATPPLWAKLSSVVTCLATGQPADGILVGCFDGSVVQVGVPVDNEASQRTLVRPCASRVDVLCPMTASHGLQLLLRRFDDPDGTVQVLSVSRRHCGVGRCCSLGGLDLHAGRPARAYPIARSSSTTAAALLLFDCSKLGHLDLVAVDSKGGVCARIECHPCHTSRLSAVCPLIDSHSGGCCGVSNSSVMLATGATNGQVKIWRATLQGDEAAIGLQEVSVYRRSREVTQLQFVQSRDGGAWLFIGDDCGSLSVVPVWQTPAEDSTGSSCHSR